MALYTTRGTDLMECMLLRQYQGSPNLKAYIGAYVEELDILFTEVQKVIEGRFIDTAVGKQLDIIGDILQQKRSIVFPKDYFGFTGAPGANSFGTFSSASIGGVFKSLQDSGFLITPLNDTSYRRVLHLRAFCLGINNSVIDNGGNFTQTRRKFSQDDLYRVINLYIKGTLEIDQSLFDSSVVTNNKITVNLNELHSSTTDIAVIVLLSHWFMPFGIELEINQI